MERRFWKDPTTDPPHVWYADIPLGLYVVRGESVVLMGRTGPHPVGTPIDLDELEAKKKQAALAAADTGAAAEPEPDWDVDTDLVA